MNPENQKKIKLEDLELYKKALRTQGINIWNPQQVQRETGLPPEKHRIIQRNYLALKNQHKKKALKQKKKDKKGIK